MFAKKFLSLVTLLFIGSQISNVSAAWNEDCTTITNFSGATTEGACTIAAHCKVGNLIYGVDSSSSANCKKALNGVYVFDDDAGAIVDLTGDRVGSDVTAANLVIYNCDGTTCAKTSGIIKDTSDANYVISSAGGGATSASSFEDTTCATGKINTDASNVLCLTSSIMATVGDTRYIMENVAGNAFGTGGDNNDKSIVIRTATNIYAYDNLIAADEYCVTTSTNVLTGTLDDFYLSVPASCDAYYDCNVGHLCTDVTSVSTCESGYYITSDAEGTTLLQGNEMALTGTLFSCPGGNGACTKETSTVGYVPNVSNFKTVIPFIQCKFSEIQENKIVNACTAIKADAIAAASDCATNAGGLISGNKICVDTTTGNAVPLQASNEANNGEYLINDVDNNIFVDATHEDYHVIITVADDKVTLRTKSAAESRYKYAVKNKIYPKQSTNTNDGGICETDDSKAEIKEFKSDACESDKVYYYTIQN